MLLDYNRNRISYWLTSYGMISPAMNDNMTRGNRRSLIETLLRLSLVKLIVNWTHHHGNTSTNSLKLKTGFDNTNYKTHNLIWGKWYNLSLCYAFVVKFSDFTAGCHCSCGAGEAMSPLLKSRCTTLILFIDKTMETIAVSWFFKVLNWYFWTILTIHSF